MSDTKRIDRALEERGAEGPCPRCGGTDIDTCRSPFATIPVRKTVADAPASGAVNVVLQACKQCGFVMLYRTESLGLE